jgi:hypothetical protein
MPTYSGNQNFSGRILTIRIIKYLKNITVRNLTLVGQILRARVKGFTGALGLSGSYSYSVPIRRRIYSGVLSFAGYVNKTIRKILYTTNVVSFTGVVSRTIGGISVAVSGGMSFVGQIISRFFRQTYDGTLTFTGWVTNKWTRIRHLRFTGYISSIRIIKYLSNQAVSNLTFIGTALGSFSSWNPLDVVIDSVASFTGTIRRLIQVSYKTASGVASFVGTVYNSTAGRAASYSGAVSFAGSIIDIFVVTFYTRVKNRTVSFAGTIRRAIASLSRKPTGNLSFTKDLTWSWSGFIVVIRYRTITGAITHTGEYLYSLIRQRIKAGDLSPSGTVSRSSVRITRSILGTLSISGILDYIHKGAGMAYNEVIFSGAVTRVIQITKSYTGSLGFSGRVNRHFPIETIGSGESAVKFSGIANAEKIIEVMYYGVRCPS